MHLQNNPTLSEPFLIQLHASNSFWIWTKISPVHMSSWSSFYKSTCVSLEMFCSLDENTISHIFPTNLKPDISIHTLKMGSEARRTGEKKSLSDQKLNLARETILTKYVGSAGFLCVLKEIRVYRKRRNSNFWWNSILFSTKLAFSAIFFYKFSKFKFVIVMLEANFQSTLGINCLKITETLRLGLKALLKYPETAFQNTKMAYSCISFAGVVRKSHKKFGWNGWDWTHSELSLYYLCWLVQISLWLFKHGNYFDDQASSGNLKSYSNLKHIFFQALYLILLAKKNVKSQHNMKCIYFRLKIIFRLLSKFQQPFGWGIAWSVSFFQALFR